MSEACADESLRREVESLLGARGAGDELLERSAIRYAAAPLEPGALLGQYRIEQCIGEGGMGAVYRAEDSRLRRRVAIKVLSDSFLPAPGAIDRFWVEARAVSALNHPNICTIHDVGEVNGRPYLVMELLEGSTLKERIGGRPLPRGELMEWALQIASGLEAAHAQAIIHRDLKPANIFITRSRAATPSR